MAFAVPTAGQQASSPSRGGRPAVLFPAESSPQWWWLLSSWCRDLGPELARDGVRGSGYLRLLRPASRMEEPSSCTLTCGHLHTGICTHTCGYTCVYMCTQMLAVECFFLLFGLASIPGWKHLTSAPGWLAISQPATARCRAWRPVTPGWSVGWDTDLLVDHPGHLSLSS